MTQTSFAAYGAVKAALDRLTRNMAPELAPRVRLNAIDVGGVATRSLDIVLTDDDAARLSSWPTRPMGRPGEPEDIACAVLYLVSDASSWVTGKVFEIDGGTEAPAMAVPAPPLEPAGEVTASPMNAPAGGTVPPCSARARSARVCFSAPAWRRPPPAASTISRCGDATTRTPATRG